MPALAAHGQLAVGRIAATIWPPERGLLGPRVEPTLIERLNDSETAICGYLRQASAAGIDR